MTTDYKSGTMPNVTCQFLEGLLVVSCMILFFTRIFSCQLMSN